MKLILRLLSTIFLICTKIKAQPIECDLIEGKFLMVSHVKYNESYYQCNFFTNNSANNPQQEESIRNYQSGRTDDDVKYLTKKDVNDSIKVLDSSFCEKFKNLEAMAMSFAKIELVSENSLQNCKNLKFIDIGVNKITELPEKFLAENANIKMIRLDSNKLTSLPGNLFLNQYGMEFISLNENHITALPSNLFKNLNNLVELLIYENQIQIIHPEWFTDLRKLEVLKLNKNKITEIHGKTFSSLVHLQKLYLSNNLIKILSPKSFDGLINLKILGLSHNQISELPSGVFAELNELTELFMINNSLKIIHSNSFGINKNLKSIYLDNNQISSFDYKIIENTAVSSLSLYGNTCASSATRKRGDIKTKFEDCIKSYQNLTEVVNRFSNIRTNQSRVDGDSCGRSIDGVGNIIGGSFINRGSYPWIAAMVYSHNDKYFCGGTLISNQKIITAAHCIQDKDSSDKLLPRMVTVLLGFHNVSKPFEIGRKTFAVFNIHVHPAWNPLSKRFDADIAVLVLDESVTFNRHIKPICMMQSVSSPAVTISSGIVVGYGKSEDETKIHEETPKTIVVPIYSNEKCFLEFPDLARISSSRTFCGGTADGTGVCLGDSGSGLIIKYNGAYYLRGIVSSSLRTFRWGCDVDKYSVFTDVIKYVEWINGINVEDPYNSK